MTRRTAFVLCLIVLFGYEAYTLFLRETGLAGNEPLAGQRYLTREVNAETPLSQTFVAHADGFNGIEIFARPSEQPAVGPLDIRVSQVVGEKLTPLAHVSLDVARLDLSAAGSVVVATPPLTPSAGAPLRLDVAMPQAPRGHGVRFEAGGPTYAYGALSIGGREEWGDLKFRTLAERATVMRNIRLLRRTWPAPLHNDGVWFLGLVIANWALATLLYYLVFAPDAKGSVLTTADQPRV